MNKLLRTIQENHLDAATRRYRGRNVIVADDEVESEFLLGCYKGILQADVDRGNPLNFIVWKGQKAVASMMKGRIQRSIRALCATCGFDGRPGWRNRTVVCEKCGGLDVRTRMILVSEDAAIDEGRDGMPSSWDRLERDEVDAEIDLFFSVATYDVVVEEIRSRLSGRVGQLFDLIVTEEINRDTSRNYLDEIARRWGVSTPCVAVYLRKLRAAVIEYFEDGDS